MKHKRTLNWINVKYTQVDLLRLKWRFLQRASDRPKSNAPCWQTLDRHLVIRHQKILLNVFRRSVIGAWSVSKKRLLNVLNNRVLGPSLIVDTPARCIKISKQWCLWTCLSITLCNMDCNWQILTNLDILYHHLSHQHQHPGHYHDHHVHCSPEVHHLPAVHQGRRNSGRERKSCIL